MRERHGIAERIERQAGVCTSMGLPFYGTLLSETARAYRENAAAVTVVLHTVMTEHLTPAHRDALRASIEATAERASVEAFAWARMEAGERSYETSVTIWPAREEIFLARSDGHAQQIEWSVRVS